MNVSNMSADELVNIVMLSDSPTKLELALSNKLTESRVETERIQEVFLTLSEIVDLEI